MDEETDVLVRTMHEVIDRLAELNQELESMVSFTLKARKKGAKRLEFLVYIYFAWIGLAIYR